MRKGCRSPKKKRQSDGNGAGLEKEVVRVTCACAPQVARSECEKDQFYDDMASEWDLQNPGEMILGLGTSTDILGDGLMALKVCVAGMGEEEC